MGVSKELFGKTKEGQEIYKYWLSNSKGMKAGIINYGAILVNLFVPDKEGNTEDIVLGYDHLEDYFTNGSFFGATIGPNANRIGNASFTLNGVKYQLAVNDGANNLHSDYEKGYHKRVYDVTEGTDSVTFAITDADGSMGFPGNKTVQVTYTLTEENELKLHYEAESDKDTIINMTNHSYFNLAGHDAGSICDEKMMIDADAFTELGQGSICTGKVIPVEGTPMDFRTARRVGDHIDDAWPQLTLAGGYDHNWVLNTEFGKVQKFAQVENEKAGRTMEVYTDLPGVQFYAGNFIDPQTGKDGASYGKRCALCLETQYFPNSINIPSFLQPVVEAGKAYHSVTIYKFV